MKSGASDPFADDAPSVGNEQDAENEQNVESEPSSAEPADADDATEESSSPDESSEDAPRTISKEDLPLLLRREAVKDKRENVHQLFVQDETDSLARQAENELSERLDTDVYRLDAREAIYLAGMKNLGDAEEILEEWGYNF